MNKVLITVIAVLMVVGAVIFGARFLSGEDSWICSNGQWVKHGVPSAPMPATGCGAAQNPSEKTVVKIFFNNDKFDPGMPDCGKVYPVNREILKTPAVARAALEELIKGTTEQEKSEGYVSNIINKDVIIQSLTINDGVARVDFDEAMERGMGGSCRVAAVRSQITQTLKQFPTISQVIISVDGRTEDILQP